MRDYSAIGKLGGRPRRKSFNEIMEGRNQAPKIKNTENKIRIKRREVKSVDTDEYKTLMELVKLEYREKTEAEKLGSPRLKGR